MVSRELEGLSGKLKNARFGPRSYGDQRNSFHLRVVRAAKKPSSNIFLENKRNCAIFDRSVPTRKALVQSILIDEVKDMKSNVLQALKASHF
jgi:hypothetical protein